MKNRCSKPKQAKTACVKAPLLEQMKCCGPGPRAVRSSWSAPRSQVGIHLEQRARGSKRSGVPFQDFALECLHAHANERVGTEELPQSKFQSLVHPAAPLFAPILFKPATGAGHRCVLEHEIPDFRNAAAGERRARYGARRPS